MTWFTSVALAGVTDFNNLISDSQEARRELQKELKKNVKSLDQTEEKATVVIEEAPAVGEENVAVATSDIESEAKPKTNKQLKKLDRKQLKRVSEEIDAAKDF